MTSEEKAPYVVLQKKDKERFKEKMQTYNEVKKINNEN